MKKINALVHQVALNAAVRTSLCAFSERVFRTVDPATAFEPNWHHEAIAHALEQCIDGKCRRLAILLPPRHLKSMLVSVAFPAFILGKKPAARIICASYGTQLAIDLSNKTRKILIEPWYVAAFPATKVGDTDTQNNFNTTQGGYRLATTPGGAMTGMGAEFIIIDDPQKATDMHHESSRSEAKIWLDNTVHSRLNDPKSGVIIIVMQRLHEDDLIGHVLHQGGWKVLKIPVQAEEDLHFQLSEATSHRFRKGEFLQPKRFGSAEFGSLRNSMGTANFYAQYQQAPVPPAGNVFDWKWLKPIIEPPEFNEVLGG